MSQIAGFALSGQLEAAGFSNARSLAQAFESQARAQHAEFPERAEAQKAEFLEIAASQEALHLEQAKTQEAGLKESAPEREEKPGFGLASKGDPRETELRLQKGNPASQRGLPRWQLGIGLAIRMTMAKGFGWLGF